jgi:hypothetical protein
MASQENQVGLPGSENADGTGGGLLKWLFGN